MQIVKTNLKYCIQCKDKKTGSIGNFIFNNRKPFEAISPIFGDSMEFYEYLKKYDFHIKGLSDFNLYIHLA